VRSHRSGQSGFVTLAALLIIVTVTLVSTLVLTSLLGEYQAEIGARQATSALAVAEAGANWAGNKLAGSGAHTYAGDLNQSVVDATGKQVGAFDVTVTCTDGSSVTTGCTAQPASRLIKATGYVPSKTLTLGKRTVWIQTSSVLKNAVCAYTSLTVSLLAAVTGNVGSEGTANPDLTVSLGGFVLAGSGQAGSANAVTTVSCAFGCSVAGGINNNQAAGTVCSNKAQVVASFTCPTGTTDITSSATISVANGNTTLRNINVGASATVTFATVGPSDVLHVQAKTLSGGNGSTFRITGGGSVVLTLSGDLHVFQLSSFGVNSSGGLLPASNFVVESCASDATAVQFDNGTIESAVLIVPSGTVSLTAGQAAQGAILADTINLSLGTVFTFDPTANNVSALSGAFTKVNTWQDVP
jgi:hypothetical protein